MYRNIIEKLKDWKDSPHRKPLILMGARQVGKTHIANIFGNEYYDNVCYVMFEGNDRAESCFENFDTNEIINRLENYKKQKISKNNTLIIFDEVQNSKKALTSLKFFLEENNDYHIIALGSLLGVATHREKFSFPVGKVDMLNMYPLGFDEFLKATNNDFLLDKIESSFLNNKKLDDTYHYDAINLYRTYLFTGGMPEAVKLYIDEKNYTLISIKLKEIIKAYLSDMGKYNRESEMGKAQLIYKNVSVQLAKENKKFKYSLINKNARARDYEEALEWLELSGITKKIYRLDHIKLPLNAYEDLNDFKVYMNDVGILVAISDIEYEDIYYKNEYLNDFMGGLTENYVFNELKKENNLYYYSNENTEIDFITRINRDIIPIEVKSREHTKSKSLNKYMEKYNPKYGIRISEKNFGFENNIKSIPLYAVYLLNKNY